MSAVLAKNLVEMTLIHHQHPIQAFSATAPDPTFGVGVRSRRHERSHGDSSTGRPHDQVRAGCELLIAVVDHVAFRRHDPDSAAARAVVSALGFRQAGTQQDEVYGLELVFAIHPDELR